MELLISIIIILYSSILHEIAHGFVAYRLGDPTAKLRGRITLNPSSHIDPFLSILMPVLTYLGSAGTFIFGGAKPVPVDPFNLREGIKDLAIVSLVGPLTNILLAIFASVLAHVLYPDFSFAELLTSGSLGFILGTIVKWNLVLAIFNLLPVPPLDGSKVFALILPKKEAGVYLSLGSSGLGLLLVMVLLFSPFGVMNLIATLITFSLSLLGF